MSVYLFIPNLIGYARLATCAWACWLMATQPVAAVALYSLSCLLDALDGYAARALDQSSRFGAVLDMVLDRATTLCLLVRLAVQLANYFSWAVPAIQLLAALDLVSHYSHMYASLVTGSESHKSIDKNAPWILRMYYQSKTVLFIILLPLAGGSAVEVAVVLVEETGVLRMGVWTIAVLSGIVVNVIQLIGAANDLVAFDVKSRAKGKRRR
ncbi:hypothetical protein HK100_000520 [Physocladia obscura]|uniref:CDP-diacylglycerol--inositol 3-phosphatidyltransferase n=1 Tax=Physocladia obscura TaxID=109957 RepID=A0AAD5XBR6_9FUNG|nr:hypothetical protein HK100_000520 [Physocladia obscura]